MVFSHQKAAPDLRGKKRKSPFASPQAGHISPMTSSQAQVKFFQVTKGPLKVLLFDWVWFFGLGFLGGWILVYLWGIFWFFRSFNEEQSINCLVTIISCFTWCSTIVLIWGKCACSNTIPAKRTLKLVSFHPCADFINWQQHYCSPNTLHSH